MVEKLKKIFFYFTFFSLVVLLGISASLLFSRFHYQKGLYLIKVATFSEAEYQLKQSFSLLPFKQILRYFITDEQKVSLALGRLFYEKSLYTENLPSTLEVLRRSSQWYQRSVSLNRYDYLAVFGLAKVAADMQRLYARYNSDRPNPYDASSYFKKALELRPNSVTVHSYYVEYLAENTLINEAEEAIQRLISLYPQAYYALRKQSYYFENYISSVEKGANQAIENRLNLRDAYLVLSAIANDKGDRGTAIENFSAAMSLRPEKNSEGEYLRYGRLLLEAGEYQKASDAFVEAIRITKHQDRTIRSIYGSYEKLKKYKAFADFGMNSVDQVRLSQMLDICLARNLALAGRTELAIARLNRVDDKKYLGEKFYYLAKIYQSQEDWSSVELAIQRATVYEPQNSSYYVFFATALSRQKKYLQAEQAMDKAIRYADKANPWYFSQRGSSRYSQKNYSGALADWLKAISLDSDKAAFYYRASMAYQALGDSSNTLIYAKKAVEKEPGNNTYKKYLQRFEGR